MTDLNGGLLPVEVRVWETLQWGWRGALGYTFGRAADGKFTATNAAGDLLVAQTPDGLRDLIRADHFGAQPSPQPTDTGSR